MFRNVYWHHAVRAATVLYKRMVENAVDLRLISEEELIGQTDDGLLSLVEARARASEEPRAARLAEVAIPALRYRRLPKRALEIQGDRLRDLPFSDWFYTDSELVRGLENRIAREVGVAPGSIYIDYPEKPRMMGLDLLLLQREGGTVRLSQSGRSGLIDLPSIADGLYHSARVLRIFSEKRTLHPGDTHYQAVDTYGRGSPRAATGGRLHPVTVEGPEEGRNSQKRAAGRSALVVIGDRARRGRVEAVLTVHGYDLRAASGGTEKILATIVADRPDLGARGLAARRNGGCGFMPRHSGALYSREQLPIIAVLSEVDAETASQALARGASDYVVADAAAIGLAVRADNLLELKSLTAEKEALARQLVEREKLASLGLLVSGVAQNSTIRLLEYQAAPSCFRTRKRSGKDGNAEQNRGRSAPGQADRRRSAIVFASRGRSEGR